MTRKPKPARAPAAPTANERLSLNELADHLTSAHAEWPEGVIAKMVTRLKDAIVNVYGGPWTPDRELAVLSLVKEDGRFFIESVDDENHVGLVAHRIDAAPAKTLGDHVADAVGRAQKIPWKHDVGSSVLLLTDGQSPRKAVIRNITDQGAFAHYDLNLGADGGTVDGVEAWRIGRDLDAEGRLEQVSQRLALHERHHQRGAELSQRYLEQRAEEARLAEVLSKHKKKIQETVEDLAEHNRKDPNQLELQDAIGEGKAEYPTGEKPAATSTIANRVAAGDVIGLAELPFDFQDLAASRISATDSTGKPPTVRPVSFMEIEHALVDVQDGVAVLLPLQSKADWCRLYEDSFGPPKDLPSDAGVRFESGGRLFGWPVKVGRGTRYCAAEAEALLVRLPADLANAGDAEPAPSGKDAAAGG